MLQPRCGTPEASNCLLNQLTRDGGGQALPLKCSLCQKSERDLNKDLRGAGSFFKRMPTGFPAEDVLSMKIIERLASEPSQAESSFASNAVSRTGDIFQEVTDQLNHPHILFRPTPVDLERPIGSATQRRQDLGTAIASLHDPAQADLHRTSQLRVLLRGMLSICGAVGYAHEAGVVHCDIRPGNVLLGAHGEFLLTGWGRAQEVGVDSYPITDSFAELMVYWSPELARSACPTASCDIFSLGATLCELLTGKPPYDQQTSDMEERVEHGDVTILASEALVAPAALVSICRKAMAEQPEDRYGEASELGRDIERWLDNQPVSAHSRSWLDHAFRFVRRRPGAAILLVAMLSLATLLSWIVIFRLI